MRNERRTPGVCLMTETYHPVTGGGETQARVIARGMVRAGRPTIMLTRRTDRRLSRDEMIDGVRVLRLAPVGPGHLRKWGLCLTALWTLFRRRNEYAVLLVCGYRVLGIPAVLISLMLGKPCVLKADSLGEYSGRFFDPGLSRFGLRHDRFPISLAVRLRNLLLRSAERFVAISDAVAQELSDAGLPREKIERIANSVDTDVFRPVDPARKADLRARLGILPEQRVAVFTGRLVTTKGLPLLLASWPGVLSKYPDSLLLIVGSGGLGLQNCEHQLRDYVAQKALQDSVRFTGSVTNVRDYLQAADVFVFPSEREAFGISVAEAMACALPVVTTNIEGISDVVVPGQTASVVVPGDGPALLDAICSLFGDEARAAALGDAGRRRAVEYFSETSVVSSYLEMAVSLSPSRSGGAD